MSTFCQVCQSNGCMCDLEKTMSKLSFVRAFCDKCGSPILDDDYEECDCKLVKFENPSVDEFDWDFIH